jgi:hypothetical protein
MAITGTSTATAGAAVRATSEPRVTMSLAVCRAAGLRTTPRGLPRPSSGGRTLSHVHSRRPHTNELRSLDAPLMEERSHPVRPWLITGLILLAVVVVTSALFYAPLEVGEVSECPEGSEAVAPEETDDGPVEDTMLCLIQHEAGRVIVFGLAVRNGGPLPITVTGLEFDTAVREILEVDAVRTGTTEGRTEDRVALEPFGLAPGQQHIIEVEATLRPCDSLRGGRLVTLTHLPVRTRFAMVSKTAHVPLTSQLGVLLGSCGP